MSKGSNLMYAAISNNILENIAQNYVDVYRKKTIQKIQMQTSILNVKCGEWCEDCLKIFVDLQKLEDDTTLDVEDKKNIIDYYKRGVCKGPCVCSIDKTQITNDVIFITDNVVIDDTDINIITEKLNMFLSEQYKKEGFKTASEKQKVAQIINDINVNLSTYITQSVATFQTVEIEGAGTIKNLSMEVMVHAIMRIMVNSKTSIETLNSITQGIFEKITQSVQNTFADELKSVFKKYKNPLIILGSLFILAFCLQIFMFFYQIYAVTK